MGPAGAGSGEPEPRGVDLRRGAGAEGVARVRRRGLWGGEAGPASGAGVSAGVRAGLCGES